MSYFIFNKNSDNLNGSLYKIAENQSDLNNLNLQTSEYKIITDSQENFNAVKYKTKSAESYNGETINYINIEVGFANKEQLTKYINEISSSIKDFTKNNSNHPLYDIWNNYLNQLNSLNVNNITYPLNISLEQYFNNLNQLSLNPLQLP